MQLRSFIYCLLGLFVEQFNEHELCKYSQGTIGAHLGRIQVGSGICPPQLYLQSGRATGHFTPHTTAKSTQHRRQPSSKTQHPLPTLMVHHFIESRAMDLCDHRRLCRLFACTFNTSHFSSLFTPHFSTLFTPPFHTLSLSSHSSFSFLSSPRTPSLRLHFPLLYSHTATTFAHAHCEHIYPC